MDKRKRMAGFTLIDETRQMRLDFGVVPAGCYAGAAVQCEGPGLV